MVTYNNEGKITTDAAPTVGLAAPTTPPTGGPAERYMPPGDNLHYNGPISELGKVVLENNPAKVLPTVSNERQFHLLIVNDYHRPVNFINNMVGNAFTTTQVVLLSELERRRSEYNRELKGRTWSSVILVGISSFGLRETYPEIMNTIENGTYTKDTKIAEIY